MKIYACDFETTTIETNPHETWVWSYGIRELYTDKFLFGHTVEDFMKWCSKGSKHLFFHNLKFDGHFIIAELFRMGFEHNPGRKAKEKTFKTVITKEGLFYEIDICWYAKNGKVKHTLIQDSYKKLPFTIDRIAKAFKMPFKKGDIDYKKIRPKGYVMTSAELDYLKRDVDILARALEIQYEQGLEKMTIGSDSLNQFKNIISENKFKNLFPILDAPHDSYLTIDDWIRESYKGGYTYVNPKHQGKVILYGKVYDVNSLYPAVMYDKVMPWGEPVYYKGRYKENKVFPLYIQKLYCEFDVKEGYLPTIQLKNTGRYGNNEYLESSKSYDINGNMVDSSPTELTLTSVDLQLFFDHYDVKVHEWIEGYMFRAIKGIFCPYIDKYMEIKKNSVGAERELAKLLLNNLYGKFATSTDGTRKIPYVDPDTGVVKMRKGDTETKNSIYTPVGSFITSYAREITIRSAQELGDRFIYADTDSLHITGLEIPNIDIDPVELGKWKHEGDFVRGKFLRAKTYVEEICLDEKGKETTFDKMKEIKLKVTCAGMNDKIKYGKDEEGNPLVTFENFQFGQQFYGKLVPKVIKGGVVLVDDYFTLQL